MLRFAKTNPLRFGEIPGNQTIKEKLVRTVSDQRVSHAQLFFGPEESDKLALAIAYAQYINCTGRDIPSMDFGDAGDLPKDSCGTCPSCVKYQKLVHPDLHFIYPVNTTPVVKSKPRSRYFTEQWRKFLFETNYSGSLLDWYDAIGIENKQGIINADDCNEIITTLSYKSYESEYKVMVLWMVERLYHGAAPKLLKILEEPPDKTLFILVTEDPSQVISTILSRTLMVKIPASATSRAVASDVDNAEFPAFRQWMRDCFSGKVPALLQFTTDISKAGRERQKSFLSYALRTTGICIAFNYTGKVPGNVTPDEAEFIRKFAPQIRPEAMPAFGTLLNDAIFHIERNAHPGALFLDLSLKFIELFKPGFFPVRKQQVS